MENGNFPTLCTGCAKVEKVKNLHEDGLCEECIKVD